MRRVYVQQTLLAESARVFAKLADCVASSRAVCLAIVCSWHISNTFQSKLTSVGELGERMAANYHHHVAVTNTRKP